MLNSLTIINYTLSDHLEVDFSGGMSAITGETGAGKSLIVDALGMALGDRGDTGRIRPGANKAEVAAQFDIDGNMDAATWLADNDYLSNDGLSNDGDRPECLLRRVLTSEGRSRGYINGQPATMQQLKELGERLVEIHGQHEHQSLLRRDSHLSLLDEYGDHGSLLARVKKHYQQWQKTAQNLAQLEDDSGELDARRDLLTFQVQELDQLTPLDGELDELESQQQMLANADAILSDCHSILSSCHSDDTPGSGAIASQLHRALQLAQGLTQHGLVTNSSLSSSIELLESAHIQTEEAVREIEYFVTTIDNDPAQLTIVEDRLSSYYQLARKHRVEAHELAALHQTLTTELRELSGGDNTLEHLRDELEQLSRQYLANATKLSKARKKSAANFEKHVNAQLAGLGMETASLKLAITPRDTNDLHPKGMETVELLAQTNPGHPHRPLAKIASGGELSRFSLAIRVIAAQRANIPALIFDEVDVGIGGATAEVVGKLLRELGQRGQVVAVTHLAQVASCAHQHLVATKLAQDNGTHSQLLAINNKHRVDEIARMLGGTEITSQTLAHAKEMLANGQLAQIGRAHV